MDESDNGNFNANQNINISLDNDNNNNYNFNNNQSNNSEEQQGQKSKHKIADFYRKSSNPSVALTTVGLKLLSLFFFLFLDLIASDAFVMIIVLLLVVADFWYTKNISGRKLVGLRWWNRFNPDTQQDIWTFESKNEIKEASSDRKTFWLSLYGYSGAWLILIIWECTIFNFMWGFYCLICLAISGINTYGFFRCSKLQQKGAKLILQKYMKK